MCDTPFTGGIAGSSPKGFLSVELEKLLQRL